MLRYLKKGSAAATKAADDAKVRETVTGILADIVARGDVAVRELAKKFDGFEAKTFRMTAQEVEECVKACSPQIAIPWWPRPT